jgi:hypothetical protein
MKYLIYTAGVALLLLTGCGSKKPDPKPEVKPPVAAELVFPAQNSTCISGDVISATQSSVVLKWKAAQNTESYDVTIKNLLTAEITTQSSTVSQVTVTLARNTPYSWYVTSKSSAIATTTNSNVWKFYNSGDGLISYAPFPADSLSPASGLYITMPATGAIKLSWQGSDTDNDIVDYDVYFGKTASPVLYKKNVTTTSLDGVPIVVKTQYYWKVVTRDSKNNTSTSAVVQFNTN